MGTNMRMRMNQYEDEESGEDYDDEKEDYEDEEESKKSHHKSEGESHRSEHVHESAARNDKFNVYLKSLVGEARDVSVPANTAVVASNVPVARAPVVAGVGDGGMDVLNINNH